MATPRARVELPGTVTGPLHGSAPRAEEPNPEERITVTVVVRSRTGSDDLGEALEAISRRLPHERSLLSPEEISQLYGSDPKDLAAVQAFAAEHGLQVIEASAARSAVELSGSLADFSRAFGVRLKIFDAARRPYRTHDDPVSVPRELRGIVEDVIGLDDRPLLNPHAAAAAGGTVTKLAYVDPRKLAEYYGFPPGATGAGQTVAILQFGGGFNQSDLETYFRLRGIKMPEMALVELSGQTNQPADRQTILNCAAFYGLLDPSLTAEAEPNGCKGSPGAFWSTIECSLDPQILGTVAPGARLVTYMAPDTPQGYYTAFSKAIFDESYAPSVINCSWGSCENQTPPSSMRSLDQLFQRAALKGVTLCASTGDYGDGAAACGGKATGHFPATSPHVLACGGTSVAADLSRETSWYEMLGGFPLSGGGGYSQVFDLPDWQEKKGIGAGQSGRGFPDVAAKADILTGYDCVVTDLDLPMGGTSASAPMWAALVALINETLGRPVGLLTPLLYTDAFAAALRDITESGGGTCAPTPGWDSCTGLGSPIGQELLAALRGSKPSPG
ncbi:MAG TPA: S53 family peptidase [Thermoanaerobaculia bacterium]|jgi:kumamolisin|nr:S53 family peptidase [Thermoanaerobaculia bacterium]